MNHKLVQAYKNFLTSPKYLKDEDIRFLLAIYSCKNHRASATDLTKLLGESHFIRINDRVGKIGKKIANYLNLDPKIPPYENIFFPNRREGRYFIWTLKKEIVLALEELGLTKQYSEKFSSIPNKNPSTGYWLFFCNPTIWEIDEFLSKNPQHGTYSITKHHKNYFHPGQLGLIRVGTDRRSKKKLKGKPKLQPGIYALVEVLSDPKLKVSTKTGEKIADSYQIQIKYLSNRLNTPLLLTELQEDPLLQQDWAIFRGQQASSWPLSKASFERLLHYMGINHEDEDSLFQKIAQVSTDTEKQILALEEKYKNASPQVKEVLSKRIERGIIAQKIKKLNSYRCQICEALGKNPIGFLTSEGIPYVETHHIHPVSHLEKGSLGVSNLLTVCANHHRQIHHGNVEWLSLRPDALQCRIDEREISVPKLNLNPGLS